MVCWSTSCAIPIPITATHLVFEPSELIEKLAALVPPPRSHLTRYHGVLASASPLRSSVVPGPVPERPPQEPEPEDSMLGRRPMEPLAACPTRWIPWAELLMRVFGLLG